MIVLVNFTKLRFLHLVINSLFIELKYQISLDLINSIFQSIISLNNGLFNLHAIFLAVLYIPFIFHFKLNIILITY